MTQRVPWRERSFEEAHLFNPAFCGALAFELVKSFSAASGSEGIDTPLVFIALPVVLHKSTRRRLPSTVRTSVYTWLQRHPEVLVGFANRARDFAPSAREAVMFCAARETISITENGKLALGPERASFTPKFLESSTPEIREIVAAVRLVGRLFASAGTTSTLMAAWRVSV